MKKFWVTFACALTVAASQAAPLSITEVNAPAINCVFNLNCTNLVEDTVSTITLPGTTGSGFLQSRIVSGEPDSF